MLKNQFKKKKLSRKLRKAKTREFTHIGRNLNASKLIKISSTTVTKENAS